jgi:hypothetical protein
MLSASQNQEESAQKQNLVISDDDFQVSSFESSVQVRASLPPSESAPKRELAAPEPREFASVEAVTPEWSSFEGISDSLDIQAPKSVDSIEVAEAIRTHVELLRSSGQGKLDVVLRPDGHTELRLQVEKVNGQILVQARCDRGDFVRLEANWSAVQQSLAQQGVRVEALQNGAAFQQHGWNDSSRSSHQHDGSPREHEPKFIDLERPVPNRPKKPATSSGSARGWQSWA